MKNVIEFLIEAQQEEGRVGGESMSMFLCAYGLRKYDLMRFFCILSLLRVCFCLSNAKLEASVFLFLPQFS